jgi:hypothetical protein
MAQAAAEHGAALAADAEQEVLAALFGDHALGQNVYFERKVLSLKERSEAQE